MEVSTVKSSLAILLVRANSIDIREDVVNDLLSGRTVIINYTDMSGADRKAVEDFISGAVFASNLQETQISDNIIIYGAQVESYVYQDRDDEYEEE
jgi:FtsZ-interacting cell division protein YlmF